MIRKDRRMKYLALSLLAFSATPALAQANRPPAPVAASGQKTILFIGNSFTQGALSAVRRYRADAVTDLNGEGIGGVPALFKTFTEQARQNWKVSLETAGGQSLAFHYEQRRARFSGRYDYVVLQEYSTLDRDKPGDSTSYFRYAPLLANYAAKANPRVEVLLMATWSRPDLVYRPGSPWSGKPIEAMALDLRAAADRTRRASPNITGVLPVGEAWNRAFASGLADPNPYDGQPFGQVSLWTHDQYHGSIYGYYLEALVVFGKVTGVDPRTLGAGERAADDLGISQDQAVRLQRIAFEQLAESARR